MCVSSLSCSFCFKAWMPSLKAWKPTLMGVFSLNVYWKIHCYERNWVLKGLANTEQTFRCSNFYLQTLMKTYFYDFNFWFH